MRVRTLFRRPVALAASLSLGLLFVPGPQIASAATPTLTVTIRGDAGHLLATGKNYPHRRTLTLEFDQNNNGADIQDFTIVSNSKGKINSGTESVFVTASCIVGVSVIDPSTASILASTTISTAGRGCNPGSTSATSPGLGHITVTGTGWTPSGDVAVEFDDGVGGPAFVTETVFACGTLAPGSYPPSPAGQIGIQGGCSGFDVFSHVWCTGAPVTVALVARDNATDYIAPTQTVTVDCS